MNGRRLGFDTKVVEVAAAAIEKFIEERPDLPVLLTLRHLAHRSGVSWSSLRRYVEGLRTENYTFFRIRKRSGGHRLISVPEQKLMVVQRWIAAYILSQLPVHRASFAFAPRSSIVRCAEQHCEARWLIKLDISGFFGSISEIQVYRVFQSAGYSPLLALELTRLCTHASLRSSRYNYPQWRAYPNWISIDAYRQRYIGYLPQGAPSSPMLSNLVMRDVDKALANVADARGLTYTRYSDDITFSTTSGFGREIAVETVRQTTAILRRYGLKANDKKTRIVPPGARKVVLGLLVDGPRPRLPREFRDRLRQHLYYLEKFGPEAHRAARNFDTVSGLYRHIRGLIDFSNSVDAEFAASMRRKFETIPWSLDAPIEA